MAQEYCIQSVAGNCFVTVNGPISPGAGLFAQPFSGGPGQQFIPAAYPGTDLADVSGTVCVIWAVGAGVDHGLVITANDCHQDVRLSPFSRYDLRQIWANEGVGRGWGTYRNCANGCMLDLEGKQCDGGHIQTYPDNGSGAQQWSMMPLKEAASAFARRDEGELAGAS